MMKTMSNTSAEQRRAEIARMLADNPSATQQQLAAELGVSQNTVSKDLRGLNLKPLTGRGRPRGSTVTPQVSDGPTPGDDLVALIRSEMSAKNLEPDAREEGLLEQIRQISDEIAELDARIEAEGLTFKPATPGGPPRMHPAVAEKRQNRSVLARLLSQIQLEESVRNPVKAKAANTRWRSHNLARAARANGTAG